MDDAANQLSDASERMLAQLNQLQQAIFGSRQAVQDAAGMAEALNSEIE